MHKTGNCNICFYFLYRYEWEHTWDDWRKAHITFKLPCHAPSNLQAWSMTHVSSAIPKISLPSPRKNSCQHFLALPSKFLLFSSVNSNTNLNFRKLFNVCYAQIIVLCMNIYLINCKKTFDQLFHLHTNMCVWRERRKAKLIMHIYYCYAIYNNVYTVLYVILLNLIASHSIS